MDFLEVIKQARAMLQSEGRITYRTLKYQFQLDDEGLEALKEELLFADPQLTEVDGRGLVWNGETETPKETPAQLVDAPAAEPPASAHRRRPAAERKIVGAAGECESGAAVAKSGEKGRSSATAGRDLWLVYGRL